MNKSSSLILIVLLTVFNFDLVKGQVCNIYCDGKDPNQGVDVSERIFTELFGRRISLHISDVDNMAYAQISNGDPTDHVWIDRSWNGGAAWPGKLGEAYIPSGSRSIRTLMFNVDNPADRQLGALRACGQPGDRQDIACTSWVRSNVRAGTRVEAGATALMQFYTDNLSNWGWWTGANCLTAMLDYFKVTGDRSYDYIVDEIFERNKNAHYGNYTNEYIDDTLWWGLAWVGAYDLTGNPKYLEMAQIDADYSYDHKDSVCGGGLWWTTDRSYKNAITNELFIKLAGALHNRIPGDTKYLGQANEVWAWFRDSGMINGENLINDGLRSDCTNNGDVTWSYNQGVILGGLVELSKATGDPTGELMSAAASIADAVLSSPALTRNGILHEYGCGDGDCGADGPSFKGVFVRNLRELNVHRGDDRYKSWLVAQADSIWENDRNSLNQFGLLWQGPFNKAAANIHHSAFEAIIASL